VSSDALAGTGGLISATLRRDRLRIGIWLTATVAMVGASAESIKGLFPTQADLDQAAAASSNPAILAFNGPPIALDTIGGQIVFQIGAPGLVIVGLMALLTVVRLTRGEEEPGRLELVRALPVGRNAPIVAAAAIGLGMSAVVGGLSALALVAAGQAGSGSVIYGLELGSVAAVFVGIALVAAQITENSRLAGGLAGASLAAAFVIRAIGDMQGVWISWLSPMGWAQQARAFDDERWWPFLLSLALLCSSITLALALQSRRDLGAGLIAPRPGPPVAGPRLRTALALAIRLQRGSVIGWCVGLAGIGVAYGSIINAIEEFVRDNPTMADFLASSGGASLTDSYLATSVHLTALIGTAAAVQWTLRLRTEETALHAEPVLATAVSRAEWTRSHLLVALAGSVAAMASVAIGLGGTAAAATRDPALLGRVAVAALAHVPAMWLTVGFTLALVGRLPRFSIAAWALVADGIVIAMFGGVLQLPGWALDLSPFEHVPLAPAESITFAPVLVLVSATAGLITIGVGGLRRRDIG
jgi:ABC-2 type transport system permease protein